MRTLVTGAAGFIGSTLVDRLLADGHSVVGLDDFSSGRGTNIDSAERHAEFEFVKADIVDADLVAPARRDPARGGVPPGRADLRQPLGGRPAVRRQRQRGRHRAAGRGRPQGRRAQDRAHLLGRLHLRHPAGLPDQRGRARRPGLAVCGGQGVPARSTSTCSATSTAWTARTSRRPMSTDRARTRTARPAWSRSSPRRCWRASRPRSSATGSDTRDYVFVDDVVDAFVKASGEAGGGQRFNVGTGVETSIGQLHTAIAKAAGAPDDRSSTRRGSVTSSGPAWISAAPSRCWAGAAGAPRRRRRRRPSILPAAQRSLGRPGAFCSATARASRAYRSSRSLNRM